MKVYPPISQTSSLFARRDTSSFCSCTFLFFPTCMNRALNSLLTFWLPQFVFQDNHPAFVHYIYERHGKKEHPNIP